jgi:hydroxyacylglutathione hydrolase
MLEILPVPAFRDNYIWLLHDGKHAAVVDPGEAAPVARVLQDRALTLDTILVTHHHDDHIGGVADLSKSWPATVYAPKNTSYAFPHIMVEDGAVVALPTLNTQFTVLEVPGHTLDHVAYYGANCLFCGDTLFGGGCGRLFEGTPRQMFSSLQRLAGLPPSTRVYCAHEYTEHNLRFAHSLEPDNPKLKARLQSAAEIRRRGLPTLPSTIALELETNPFLRCSSNTIRQAISIHTHDPVQIFATIRQMRNNY